MLSVRIQFPSTLSQRLWSWIWIWQNKTFPPLSTSGRIWSQYLYRVLSRHHNWMCTCHVSRTCPGLLHTRVSPGPISIRSVKSDIYKFSNFNIKSSVVLLYNLRKCQIAFSKVYFNIQYPPRMSNSCAGCDLWRTNINRPPLRPCSALSRLQTHRSPDLSAPTLLSPLSVYRVSVGSGASIKAHIKYVNVRIIHRADKRCLFQQHLEYLHWATLLFSQLCHSSSQINVSICCL